MISRSSSGREEVVIFGCNECGVTWMQREGMSVPERCGYCHNVKSFRVKTYGLSEWIESLRHPVLNRVGGGHLTKD